MARVTAARFTLERLPGIVLTWWLLVVSPTLLHAWTPGTGVPAAADGFTVNTADRRDVLAFYNTVYFASEGYASRMAWTGNVATGAAGTTSAAFKEDVRRRVNFYRALTGLPGDITFDPAKCAKDQSASLMMSANNALSHSPPDTWTYWTPDGAAAAGASNLFLGIHGPPAIDGYLRDDGVPSLGHRRWIIYSRAASMGTGDIPRNGSFNPANALWVLTDFKLTAPPQFIPWPNSGYVPVELAPVQWSVSNPWADFSGATVSMTRDGVIVPVTGIAPAAVGYGDNALTWTPEGIPTSVTTDTTYLVTVSGITGSSVPASFTYSVTLFDPNLLGESVTITGPANPPTTGGAYTFNRIAQADRYEVKVATASNAAWTEGAEDSPTPRIVAATTGTYPLRQTGLVKTSNKAFQLAFPDFNDQRFTITRDLVPGAASQLQFFERGRYATPTTTLSAEVSANNGTTWASVWSRPGAAWDSDWIPQAISLAAYAGQTIQVRFIVRFNGGAIYIGTSAEYGFFLDDITVTNAAELINSTTSTLAGSATAFALNATTAGAPLVAGTPYHLRIRPNVGTRWFDFGFSKVVTPSPQATDFNTDGKPDFFFVKAGTGQTAIWYMNGPAFISAVLSKTVPSGWSVVGTGDFFSDGKPDLLLFHPASRATAIWYMNGASFVRAVLPPSVPAGWIISGVADFNGDGKPDILFFHPTGRQTAIWYMNGATFINAVLSKSVPAGWSIDGLGDFNNDGKPDILLFNPTGGQTAIWYMNGASFISAVLGPSVAPPWSISGVADFNLDGKPDLLFFNPSTRATVICYMNGPTVLSAVAAPPVPADWELVAP